MMRLVSLANTISFFGTQPRTTHVPPHWRCSPIPPCAPFSAATRATRTPPDPPPITKRSTSCVMCSECTWGAAHSHHPVLGETELVFNNDLDTDEAIDRLAVNQGALHAHASRFA